MGAPLARDRPEGRRIWSIGFVVVVCGVVAAYFFLPIGTKNWVFNVVAVATAAVMFVGIVKHRAAPRFAWILVAAGMLLMAIGDIVFGTNQPVPSVADMLYVSAYVALTLGVVGSIRSEFPSRRQSSAVDAVILAAGVAIMGVLFLVVPAAHPDGAGLAAQAVSLGYPAIDLILLAMLFKPAHRRNGRQIVYFLIAAGLLLRLIADTGYALAHYGTTYVAGDPADAFWLLSYALFGAALLHPSVGRATMEPASLWTPRDDFAIDQEPEVYAQAASIIQSQSLRFRRILALGGGILMALAAITLLLAVSWHAPEISLVSGAYGGSGMLILIASAITS
jgi:hypothetical protein